MGQDYNVLTSGAGEIWDGMRSEQAKAFMVQDRNSLKKKYKVCTIEWRLESIDCMK